MVARPRAVNQACERRGGEDQGSDWGNPPPGLRPLKVQACRLRHDLNLRKVGMYRRPGPPRLHAARRDGVGEVDYGYKENKQRNDDSRDQRAKKSDGDEP